MTKGVFSGTKSKEKIDLQRFFRARKQYFIIKPVSNSRMQADNWIILKIFAILKYELLNNETH